ncbi:MAG: hypothetical protein IT392_07225 [Nitrospirae bacterium]|nr:hypothetical protein [Nitrospirota bacterium]
MEMIIELWDFMKVRKKIWLGTIIIVFLLLGAFILFSETSVIAPLIYTVF